MHIAEPTIPAAMIMLLFNWLLPELFINAILEFNDS